MIPPIFGGSVPGLTDKIVEWNGTFPPTIEKGVAFHDPIEKRGVRNRNALAKGTLKRGILCTADIFVRH